MNLAEGECCLQNPAADIVKGDRTHHQGRLPASLRIKAIASVVVHAIHEVF